MDEKLFFIGYTKKENKGFLYFLFFYFPKLVYYPFIILSFLSCFSNFIKVFIQQHKMYFFIFGIFFISLDIIFRVLSKQIVQRLYLKIDNNKNIEIIEKDENEKEKVLDFIPVEKIKSFICNKSTSELKIQIENRPSLYFELDKKLFDKLQQEYQDKLIEDNLKIIALDDTLNGKKITVCLENVIVQYARNPIGFFFYKSLAFGANSSFPIFIRFEENKDIVMFVLNKDRTERIIKIITEENIKSITYQKIGGGLHINIEDNKQIEILLEFLNEQQHIYLVNTLIHNYMNKTTPKVIEQISKPHQIGKRKNVLILTIIGVLIVVAIIVFAIIF